MAKKTKFEKSFSFRRIEVMEATGVTSNQLQSWERARIITPVRYTELGRVVVAYTKSHVLQVEAIKKLREQISFQKVKSIIKYLNENGHGESLYDKHLIVIGEDVFWVQPDLSNAYSDIANVLQIGNRKNKGIGQYTLLVIPPLIEVVAEIRRNVRKSNILDRKDFFRRFDAA